SKQHCQEQQTASEEYSCEKTIFQSPKTISYDPDEPEKGNAGKRDDVQPKRRRCGPMGQPCARLERIGWHGPAEQPKYCEQKNRKDDARDCRSLWRSQG